MSDSAGLGGERSDPRDRLAEAAPEPDGRLVTPPPPAGLPGAAIAAGFALLAVVLFFALEGRRQAGVAPPAPAGAANEAVGEAPAAPPPLVIPPVPPPPAPAPAPPKPAPPPPRIVYVPAPAPPAPPVRIPLAASPTPALGRLAEPALTVDLAPQDAAAAGPPGGPAGDDAAAHATVIRGRSTLVPQGALISAVLETPIDSTRPGLVRAITSLDTRGFDGSRVLIPRGSRLIGEYRADVQSGQRRVVVMWTRLIRPDGVAIRIGSPAADALGGAGVAGRVDSHLLTRFSSAILQSALTVGVNLASRPGSGSVIVGAPSQLAGAAGQALAPPADLRPTITVRQGAAVTVFVARDLDFAGATPRP